MFSALKWAESTCSLALKWAESKGFVQVRKVGLALKWGKSLGWYLENRVRQSELKDRSFALPEP